MIDWDRIRELRTEILCEDFPEVFELFLEEVEEVLGRMKTANDTNTYAEDFHFLKGSAVNVGFTDFANVCCAGEISAANGNLDQINLDLVQDAYKKSLDAFHSGAKEFGHAA